MLLCISNLLCCCYLYIHLTLQPFIFCRFQHRLDLATSGVLCLCRTKKSAGKMFQEFQKRSVLKHYVALVSTYDYIIYYRYATSDILMMYLLSYQRRVLQSGCSGALAKICVTGIGNFGERSRALAEHTSDVTQINLLSRMQCRMCNVNIFFGNTISRCMDIYRVRPK